jgi:hypothetical protein
MDGQNLKISELDEMTAKGLTYSICSLVTDLEEYKIMLHSFQNAGFTEFNSEFIYIDNSKQNKYDAYTGLNKMILQSSGKYIILCHQDIELIDPLEVLEKRIKEIDLLDKSWAIIGNAGGFHLRKKFERISHPNHELNNGPFPHQVFSVDENFILIKKEANLSFSHNLKGFHMYGTDICIIADILGYNAWVIDFHLLHKSNGNMNDSFFQNKKELILKYEKAYRDRYIRTTCTSLYLSGNKSQSWWMNTKLMIILTKFLLKVRKQIMGDY